MRHTRLLLALAAALSSSVAQAGEEAFYGTREAFAAEAIYFVVTDRFVNGDTSNDQREQGGKLWHTFDRPIAGAPPGESDNIGYLGGDFRGLVDNADYIRDLGFSAVWITPIVDNPDAAFSGGKKAVWGGFWTDQGKTGYHGYWGVNFYKLDEHWPSPGLDFAGFTRAMHDKHLKVVLDIVGNHGSPSYTMPVSQAEFGKIYAKDGTLLADHQNLAPEKLDPTHNPLHRFFNTKPGIAELSDLNENNPAVLDYLAGAYAQWLNQGADALRIDTIGWMPHAFWKQFAARMRAVRPDLFMFGEDFDYDAGKIAPHTYPENGGIRVLDFPMKAALAKVFEKSGGDFAELDKALFLENGPYANPYELMTFYDNHDMPRLNADDNGFIDANNWLFTARGIPIVYYGSEIGFMRGRAEHAGNRNYFGVERIKAAPEHPIYQNLKRIAQVRAAVPALQRGLQVNLELKGDSAAFLRVLDDKDVRQTALVLLNKGDAPARFTINRYLDAGRWRPLLGGATQDIAVGASLNAEVPGHGVAVYLRDGPIRAPALTARLRALMKH